MKQIWTSVIIYSMLTVLTGFCYPLFVTLVSQSFFPSQAEGSLIIRNGAVVGSTLIGQKFAGQNYFWPRPSTTDYNTMPSSGSNLPIAGQALSDQMTLNSGKFSAANSLPASETVPTEMLFSSGSGLDPHISVRSAILQAGRVAAARCFDKSRLDRLFGLIRETAEERTLDILGEPRINVLKLNLALEGIK
ncbi:MAG: potassium-transporting ATPase subunit KdpC [Candidatus Wallbacteria bacterium]|nr:potassium-transporting ATPase subunit KdpC [Candidatus Wallbacteria bacterium]